MEPLDGLHVFATTTQVYIQLIDLPREHSILGKMSERPETVENGGFLAKDQRINWQSYRPSEVLDPCEKYSNEARLSLK